MPSGSSGRRGKKLTVVIKSGRANPIRYNGRGSWLDGVDGYDV